MGRRQFQEGDRVRARESQSRVKAAMIGTVMRVFVVLLDTYGVQFDDLPFRSIIEGAALEPVSQDYAPVG
jgi:hypothetical protein